MDAQDFRSLQEAYLEVYQEIDEAITSEKGKAKAAEMIAKRSTPSGRAKSGQGANVAQIKHIGRANVENLSGTPATPTIAKNPVKSRSYGGTGNKAARRAAALNKEQVDIYDIILSHLLDEGYADTNEAAIAIMANMSEEWREDIMEVLDTPEKANEYGKKALRSSLGAAAKTIITKDKKHMKTIDKRLKGAEMVKRKAERKASEEG